MKLPGLASRGYNYRIANSNYPYQKIMQMNNYSIMII